MNQIIIFMIFDEPFLVTKKYSIKKIQKIYKYINKAFKNNINMIIIFF